MPTVEKARKGIGGRGGGGEAGSDERVDVKIGVAMDCGGKKGKGNPVPSVTVFIGTGSG